MVSLKVQQPAPWALWAVVLLVAAVAAAASATHARHHLHREKKLVEHNVRMVMKLKARGPQPRVVIVAPVLKLKSSEMVEPWQTVLHRCDDVACCAFSQMPGKRCLPEEQPVALSFRATDLTTKKVRDFEHKFFNHTACHCRAFEAGP